MSIKYPTSGGQMHDQEAAHGNVGPFSLREAASFIFNTNGKDST